MKVTELQKRHRGESQSQRGILAGICVIIIFLGIGAISLGASMFSGGSTHGLASDRRITELPTVLTGDELLAKAKRTQAGIALRIKLRQFERHHRELIAQGVQVEGLDEVIEYAREVGEAIKPSGGS